MTSKYEAAAEPIHRADFDIHYLDQMAKRVPFVMLLMLLLALTVPAATYVVTNTDDSGAGSLRDAITAANGTADDDVIDLTGVSGTITLTTGELTILNNGTLTINGPGAGLLTVSGGDASRVFYLNQGTTTEINALTIADGLADFGGGIYNYQGTLTINNSVITDNHANYGGGIFQETGSTTLTSTTVSGNSSNQYGGGICFFGTYGGTLDINSSSISGNSAGSGGGIRLSSHGVLRVTDSAISGNSANGGGGIDWSPFGGSVDIVNSTISGNSSSGSGGGISTYSLGTVRMNITNSTIADNIGSYSAGGIRSESYSATYIILTLNNTIVSGNMVDGNPNDIRHDSATTLGGSNNIVSVNSGFTFSSGSDNQLGIDPMLGPLADNGGPTLTHALLSGSPAIDAGDDSLIPTGFTTDQRGTGFPRIFGAAVDIGSFEYSPPDADGDGVPDDADVCPGTVVPELGLFPELKKNRFAVNADGEFVDGTGAFSGYTVADTGGCSATQIVDELELGGGHTRFGITDTVLEAWITGLLAE